MRSKLLLPLICCLCYFTQASAQRQNVYFLKNSGKFVDQRDSADYIRIVKEPDSGSVLYNVSEYYLSGKLKLIGKTSIVENLRLEDQCVEFYPSGKRKEMATYKNNSYLGDIINYYPNGHLYTHRQFIVNKTNVVQTARLQQTELIETCNDSIGKSLTLNGEGYYVGYDENFKSIKEEGFVKSGLRDGDWKGYFYDKTQKIVFDEIYKHGKVLSGHSTDQSGKVYKYILQESPPQFIGGEYAFAVFLSKNIKYPDLSRDQNIQGTVRISFIVEEDGKLSELKIVESPNEELAAETIRVLSGSPKWIPATRRGIPIRAVFSVPVNFSLGEKH